MNYDRATKGNTTGIEEVKLGSDKLKQKIILMRPSMLLKLKKLSQSSGESESEIVRNALKDIL